MKYDKKIKIEEIKAELRQMIADAGPDIRDEDRLERDALYLYDIRHGGISIETMCMMLTDLSFALMKVRREMEGHK